MMRDTSLLIFFSLVSWTIATCKPCNAFHIMRPDITTCTNRLRDFGTLSSSRTRSSINRRSRRSQIWLQKDDEGEVSSATATTSPSSSFLDESLAQNDLKKAIIELKKQQQTSDSRRPNNDMTKDQFIRIFDVIEYRTSQPEENQIIYAIPPSLPQQRTQQQLPIMAYPPISQARLEMTEMYQVLQSQGILSLFGAVSTAGIMPILGSKRISPTTLESITNMTMASLTPKSKNGGGGPGRILLISGVALAVLEGLVSYMYNIDYSFLVLLTLLSALMDRLFLNGAIYEQILKVLWPTYTQQVLRHEAGHFLVSYLLGCPVEGCVLSALAAKDDPRFAIARVTAGTSFFDPDLSNQMNGQKPLTRDSIDKFSVIVMGGIAAEAICYGRADGGGGDEESLVRFLSIVAASAAAAAGGSLQPRQPIWNAELIRNQARWGVAQAVLLLNTYKPAYDALVDALERGCKLGECIYAIEKAARDHNLRPLQHPIGTIQEFDGRWELYQNSQSSPLSSLQGRSIAVEQATDPSILSNNSNADGATSEDFLKRYKATLQEKLQKLNDSLLKDKESIVKESSELLNEPKETTVVPNNPTTTATTSEEFLKKYRNLLEEKLRRLQ